MEILLDSLGVTLRFLLEVYIKPGLCFIRGGGGGVKVLRTRIGIVNDPTFARVWKLGGGIEFFFGGRLISGRGHAVLVELPSDRHSRKSWEPERDSGLRGSIYLLLSVTVTRACG